MVHFCCLYLYDFTRTVHFLWLCGTLSWLCLINLYKRRLRLIRYNPIESIWTAWPAVTITDFVSFLFVLCFCIILPLDQYDAKWQKITHKKEKFFPFTLKVAFWKYKVLFQQCWHVQRCVKNDFGILKGKWKKYLFDILLYIQSTLLDDTLSSPGVDTRK